MFPFMCQGCFLNEQHGLWTKRKFLTWSGWLVWDSSRLSFGMDFVTWSVWFSHTDITEYSFSMARDGEDNKWWYCSFFVNGHLKKMFRDATRSWTMKMWTVPWKTALHESTKHIWRVVPRIVNYAGTYSTYQPTQLMLNICSH